MFIGADINNFYITNATFRCYIAKYFSEKISDFSYEQFENFLTSEDISEKNFHEIFSGQDIKTLIAYTTAIVFCSKNTLDESVSSNFSDKKFRPYVFKTPPPAYHSNKECDFLYKNFHNLEIPVEIETRGVEAVKNFLEFADENKRLYNDDPEKFKMLATTRFLLANAFNDVNFVNSNTYNLPLDLKGMITQAIEETTRSEYISRFKYAPIYVGLKNTRREVREWFTRYKNPIYIKIEEELGNYLTSDLSFNEPFLKSLGLRACSSCCHKL